MASVPDSVSVVSVRSSIEIKALVTLVSNVSVSSMEVTDLLVGLSSVESYNSFGRLSESVSLSD